MTMAETIRSLMEMKHMAWGVGFGPPGIRRVAHEPPQEETEGLAETGPRKKTQTLTL